MRARKPDTKTGTARDNQTLSINRNNREDPGFSSGGDAALRNGVTDWCRSPTGEVNKF